ARSGVRPTSCRRLRRSARWTCGYRSQRSSLLSLLAAWGARKDSFLCDQVFPGTQRTVFPCEVFKVLVVTDMWSGDVIPLDIDDVVVAVVLNHPTPTGMDAPAFCIPQAAIQSLEQGTLTNGNLPIGVCHDCECMSMCAYESIGRTTIMLNR